jgi:hypothetical protein
VCRAYLGRWGHTLHKNLWPTEPHIFFESQARQARKQRFANHIERFKSKALEIFIIENARFSKLFSQKYQVLL